MSRVTFAARRLEQVEAAYQAVIEAGFPVKMGDNAETLQVATDTDRSNWLIFQGIVDRAIAAGQGADPIPIPIRCTSNANYTVTYDEARAILDGMTLWGFAGQTNCWRLKDAVQAAQSNTELNAIDLTEGWP